MKTSVERQFISAYELFVNEIFLFFVSKTEERCRARDLTQYAFRETWKQIARGRIEGDGDLNEIHDLLRLNARRLARTSTAHASPVAA